MPKIIFNYKICDKAAECGGIAACPRQAIYYDKDLKKPVWDKSKCTFCLTCTLPSICPVGAIMYAGDDQQEKLILDTLKSDPTPSDWLWRKRYGTFPGEVAPLADTINKDNIGLIIAKPGLKLIDVWHPDFVDCRLHSPLFSDLTEGEQGVYIFKLNAQDFPDLASRLNVSTFPSLLVFHGNNLVFTHTGYIKDSQISQVSDKIKQLLADK